MRTRFGSASPFLLALGLLLLVAAAGSAQTKDSERLSGYVSRLMGSGALEPTPGATQVLNELFAFLIDECDQIAISNSRELDEAWDFYDDLLVQTRDSHERLERQIEWRKKAGMPSQNLEAQLADVDFYMAVASLMFDWINDCITDRAWELEDRLTEAVDEAVDDQTAEEEEAEVPLEAPEEEGEESPGVYKEVYRRWTVTCDGAAGIEPPWAGIITLLLPGDGSVQGGLRPGPNNVGLEYAYFEPSTLKSDGSFRLATPAGATNQVEVLAPAHPDPPATSGTIRTSGVKEGYGRWSCTGTWSGQ